MVIFTKKISTMLNTKFVFKQAKSFIGMVHLQALPGTPNNQFSPEKIIEKAVTEAHLLKKIGFDSILIENMHDVPYLNNNAGHEISTLMSIIGYEIKKLTQLPVGVQILAGANKQALACAFAANMDYIRAKGFVFGHIADEGYMDSCAGELLRYRKQMGAESIAIFTDIKKKHSSHSLTADVSITATAEAAEFFLSDGIIITGNSTGQEASIQELTLVKQAVKIPVIIGSGISIANLGNYFEKADAFIVGSSIKKHGKWFNEIDPEYAKRLIEKANQLRSK